MHYKRKALCDFCIFADKARGNPEVLRLLKPFILKLWEECKLIEIVCAWCGKKIGERDGKGVTGISHSICDNCLKKEESKMDALETT